MCNVLILDNDQQVLDITIDLLKSINILKNDEKVITAKTIEEAKEKVTELKKNYNTTPLLAIVDIYLEHGKTGIDFIEWSRNKFKNMTILATSGYQISEWQFDVLNKFHIDGFFRKPMESTAIGVIIRQAINKAKNEFKQETTEFQEKKQYIEKLSKLLERMDNLIKTFNTQEIPSGIN